MNGGGAHKVMVRRPEGNRLLGRPRRRWEDNIKWIFKKRHGKAWTGLIWLKICNEPLGSIKCGEFLD